MKARRECCPVNRSASYAFAAVVRTQCQRMGATRDAQVIPIEFVRPFLIANPISFRIPEGAGFQSDHPKSSSSKTLRQHSARGADSDYAIVDWFMIRKSPHRAWESLYRSKPMSGRLC